MTTGSILTYEFRVEGHLDDHGPRYRPPAGLGHLRGPRPTGRIHPRTSSGPTTPPRRTT